VASAALLAPAASAQAPAEAHLSVEMSDALATGAAQSVGPALDTPTPTPYPMAHTITVSNHGPSRVHWAHLSVTPAPHNLGVDWTCIASPGSYCPASGVGAPLETPMHLAVWGTVTFTVKVWFYDDLIPSVIVNTARVGLPAGVVDPNPGNNVRTLWTYVERFPRGGGAPFFPVQPCRVLDTRVAGQPLLAGETRNVQVASQCGVWGDARAVVLNVTVVQATDSGHLKFYPTGRIPTSYTAVRFEPNRPRTNIAIVKLTFGQTGMSTWTSPWSTGSAHIILDVYGFFY
jgi:hypothetical protein